MPDPPNSPQGGWPKELVAATAKALAPLVTAAGFIGFVIFAGGTITWIRFYAAELPSDQAVAAMSRSELVVIGAAGLAMFMLLGIVAVLLALVMDVGGRPRERMAVMLVLLSAAESGIVIALAAKGIDPGQVAGAGLVVLGSVLVLTLWVFKKFKLPGKDLPEIAPLPSERAHSGKKGDEANTPLLFWLNKWGQIWLITTALLTGGLTGLLLSAWWVGAAVVLAGLLAAGAFGVARATQNSFAWFAVALFLTVVLFGGFVAAARFIDDPQVQPAALIRTNDAATQGLTGIYITQTSDRVYLGSVRCKQGSNHPINHSGHIYWVPKDQVVALSIGSMQGLGDVNGNANEMLNALEAARVSPPNSPPPKAPELPPTREVPAQDCSK